MYSVIFDYYEYSDTGEYLGENTDSQDFDTAEQAYAFLDDIMQKDHVKKAWFSLPT